MVDKLNETPIADSKVDLESANAGANAADAASSQRNAGAFTKAGDAFDSDIHVPELFRLLTGINGGSATNVKLANDTAQAARAINSALVDNARQVNSAIVDNFEHSSSTIANMIGKYNAVDQLGLAQDRKWNIDEVSGYAVLNTAAVAEVVKAAIDEAFARLWAQVNTTKQA